MANSWDKDPIVNLNENSWDKDPVLDPAEIGGEFIEEFGKGLARGTATVGAGLLGTWKKISPVAIAGLAGEKLVGGDRVNKALTNAQQSIYDWRNQFAATPEGAAGYIGSVLGETIPYMGASFAAGLTGGPLAAAGVGFAVEGEEAYQNAKKTGATEIEANIERLVVGSINAGIEALQFGRAFKFMETGKYSLPTFKELIRQKVKSKIARLPLSLKTSGKFIGNMALTAIEEGAEEALQEGISIFTPYLTRGEIPKKPTGEIDWDNILDRIGQNFAGGALAGAVLGAGSRAIFNQINKSDTNIAQKTALMDEHLQWFIDEIDNSALDDEQKGLVKINLQQQAFEIREELKEKYNDIVVNDERTATQQAQRIIKDLGFEDWAEWKILWLDKKRTSMGSAAEIHHRTKTIQIATKYNIHGSSYFGPKDRYWVGKNNWIDILNKTPGQFNQDSFKAVIIHEMTHPYAKRTEEFADRHSKAFAEHQEKWRKQFLTPEKVETKVPIEGKVWAEGQIPVGEITKEVVEKPAQTIQETISNTPVPYEIYQQWIALQEQRKILENQSYQQKGTPAESEIHGQIGIVIKQIQDIESKYDITQIPPSPPKPPAPPEMPKPAEPEFPEGKTPQEKLLGLGGWMQYAKTELFKIPEKVKFALREKFNKLDTVESNWLSGNVKETDFMAQIWDSMSGVMPREWLEILPEKFRIDIDERKQLWKDIATSKLSGGERLTAYKSLYNVLDKHRAPTPSEIKIWKKLWGAENVARFIDEKTTPLHYVAKASGALKAMLATFDISGAFIQRYDLLFANPVIWYHSLQDSIRAFGSEQAANKRMLEIFTDPLFPLFQWSGGLIRELGATIPTEKVEQYAWSEQMKKTWLGKLTLMSQSERAHIVGGNSGRFEQFKDLVRIADIALSQASGGNIGMAEFLDVDILLNKLALMPKEDTAQVVNLFQGITHYGKIMTGEGDIKWLGQHIGALSLAWFSPRRISAMFQKYTFIVPNVVRERLGLNPLSPQVRKLFAVEIVKQALIVGAFLMSLRKLLGKDKVEINPLSGDFGKVRIGNTRIDCTGGYGQIVRAVAGLTMGQYKTRAGETLSRKRGQIITSFMQSKTAPLLGLIVDFLKGETFYGSPLRFQDVNKTGIEQYLAQGTYAREILERFIPLFIQDVIETATYQNIQTAFATAPLAFLGVGVQSYEIQEGSKTKMKKNEIAFAAYGKRWDELGPDTQEILRYYNPEIDILERKAKMTREASDFNKMVEQEAINTEREIRYSLPEPVSKTLTDLGVTVGQLTRRVDEDWILNDSRFTQYKIEYTKLLQIYMPQFVNNTAFQGAARETKINALEKFMTTLRKWAREVILNRARIDDMTKLKGGQISYGK